MGHMRRWACASDANPLAPIVKHARATYYSNMREYCKLYFPPSQFECEQDGLIARCLSGQRVAWAKQQPKVQHVGWYGYHRPKSVRPAGSLEQKYALVKTLLQNPERLKRYVKDFHDIKPVVPWTYDESYQVTVAP